MEQLTEPLKATSTDEDSIVELQELVWPSAEEATKEYFRWLTNVNPWGQAVTYVVKGNSGKVVSMHIVVPLPVLINGIKSLAGISVNIATHPDFRRQGLSARLARAIYLEVQRLGIEFLISVPNTMSHGLFQKNHFTDLGKLSLLIHYTKVEKPIRVIKKLRTLWTTKIGSVPNVYEISDFKELNLDGLIEPSIFCLAINRDWLTWRYKDHPSRTYLCAIVGESDRPKVVVIYQILEVYQRLLIVDFFVSPKAEFKEVKYLLDYVSQKGELAACQFICFLGVPNSRKHHLLRKCGFWTYPFDSVWRPQIVAKSFGTIRPEFSVSTMDISYSILLNVD